MKPLRVTRVTLARCFNVHPDTILAWHDEGLTGAIVQRGGPARPALYDSDRALDWFNLSKAKPAPACFTIKTLADLEAATAPTTNAPNAPMSAALTTALRLFDDELRRRAPRRARTVSIRNGCTHRKETP